MNPTCFNEKIEQGEVTQAQKEGGGLEKYWYIGKIWAEDWCFYIFLNTTWHIYTQNDPILPIFLQF